MHWQQEALRSDSVWSIDGSVHRQLPLLMSTRVTSRLNTLMPIGTSTVASIRARIAARVTKRNCQAIAMFRPTKVTLFFSVLFSFGFFFFWARRYENGPANTLPSPRRRARVRIGIISAELCPCAQACLRAGCPQIDDQGLAKLSLFLISDRTSEPVWSAPCFCCV